MIRQTVNGQYKAIVNNSVLGLSSDTQQKVTFTTFYMFFM